MSCVRVLFFFRVDDQNSDQMSELASFDMPRMERRV